MLTKSGWDDLKNAHGIEQVPSDLVADLACRDCAHTTINKVLYSDKPVRAKAGSKSEHQKLLNGLRRHCYCRVHAELEFRDDLRPS